MLTLVLPLPPPTLSPNARGHWGKRHRATARHRFAAKCVARDAMNRLGIAEPWPELHAWPVFYFGDRRRRDKTNYNAGGILKPYYDGLQDAGLIVNDECVTEHPPEFRVDARGPRVELRLMSTEEGGACRLTS